MTTPQQLADREDRTPIPLYIQDAVNHAIHTSRIDGRERPISLCFVAVRAAMKAMEEHHG